MGIFVKFVKDIMTICNGHLNIVKREYPLKQKALQKKNFGWENNQVCSNSFGNNSSTFSLISLSFPIIPLNKRVP